MPPYEWMHLEDVLFMFAVGLLLSIGIILARGSRWLFFSVTRKTPPEGEEEAHEFGGDVEETSRPVPWLIWLVFVGYFLWAAGYIVFAAHRGV